MKVAEIQVPAPSQRRFAWSEPPIAGESLLGFVARNADKHGVMDMCAVLRAAGVDTLKPATLPTVHFEAAADIARVFKTSTQEVEDRFYRPISLAGRAFECLDYFGTHIRQIYRDAKRRRVSPASLAASPHHRAIWDLRPLAFCPESKEMLIDACPRCKAALRWRWTLGVHMCESCGADLRDFPQPKVDKALWPGLDLAAGLIHPIAELRPSAVIVADGETIETSSGDMFEFAVALAWAFADPSARRTVRKLKEIGQIDAIGPSELAAAGNLIANWGLLSEMTERFRSHKDARPGYWGIDKEMGRLAALAVDPFLAPELKQLMNRSLNAAMAGSTFPVARRKLKNTDGNLVTVLDAAKMLGAARRTIVGWHKEGLIDLLSFSGSTNSVKLMRLDDIEAIIAEREEAISRTDVAAIFGLGDADRLGARCLRPIPQDRGTHRQPVPDGALFPPTGHRTGRAH